MKSLFKSKYLLHRLVNYIFYFIVFIVGFIIGFIGRIGVDLFGKF